MKYYFSKRTQKVISLVQQLWTPHFLIIYSNLIMIANSFASLFHNVLNLKKNVIASRRSLPLGHHSDQMEGCKKAISYLEQKRTVMEEGRKEFSWKNLADQAERVQLVMHENDPVAVKNAYKQLFDSIVIGDLIEYGCRKMSFILKGCDTFSVAEENSIVVDQKVEAAGIEPASKCATEKAATCLVR